MRAVARLRLRGFTLLEVMVAIAILGLGLSVILSSQVGLFSSAARTETLSQVTGLARCKMGDIEIKLDKDGYPPAEEDDQGPCCGDDDEAFKRYTCSWKIQPIKLPDANLSQQQGDGGIGGGMAGGDQGLGALGALAGLKQSGGASLGPDAGLGGLASLMTGGGSGGPGAGGGMGGIASMVMGLVYPDLKPMLEASIRKITVTVHWKEGRNDRKYEVQQYVTNPQQGGLDQMAPNGQPGAGGLGIGTPQQGSSPTTSPASPTQGLFGGRVP